MSDLNIKVRRTEKLEDLKLFFLSNGLEESAELLPDEELVAAWEAVDKITSNLAGAILLLKRKGEYVIDSVAVAQTYRNNGLGTVLMEAALQEANKLRGDKIIYLVAKAPLFFKKFGFNNIDFQAAPPLFDCLSCPQYGSGCNPVAMILKP